jgi:hypothetical protein
MGTYETAQICNNGHVITSRVESSPELMQRYCETCGDETITKCENCGPNIRGYYNVEGVIGGPDYIPPSFCHNCGKQFPWTARRLEAAKELVETFNNLSEDEQKALQQSIDDLIRETPRTKVAETRFKNIFKKVGKEGYEAMKNILVDVVSETIKRVFSVPKFSYLVGGLTTALSLTAITLALHSGSLCVRRK